MSAGEKEVIDDGNTNAAEDDVVVHYLNVDAEPPERDPFSWREFDEGQRRNNASLVFKIIYGKTTILFTGDINGRQKTLKGEDTDLEIDSEELELWTRHQLSKVYKLGKYDLDATILQLPHHGSNGAGSLPFIEAISPQWVVIPAGTARNHPDPETLRRLSKAKVDPSHILRTDHGDQTPEKKYQYKDPQGDDSFIFEIDREKIVKIWWVKLEN